MRVVVTGASGNVGTSLVRALADEDEVDEIVGLARRRPGGDYPKTEWHTAHVERDDLVSLFRGADCVVHLAWASSRRTTSRRYGARTSTAAGACSRRSPRRTCPRSSTRPPSARTRPARRTGRWTRAGRRRERRRASTPATRPRSRRCSTASSSIGPRRVSSASGPV